MAEHQIRLDQVEDALVAIRAGQAVIVVDDESRENEGDFILAAEHATPELMGLVIRHSSGMLCVPMTGDDLDRLAIPMMSVRNTDPKRTAYTVSVDAAAGVTTGISAADRARTARLLADPTSRTSDLTMPGHIFPLRAREGGVLTRPGHTEAAVDLARLAGLRPAGVIAEAVEDDGSMMRAPALRKLADRLQLPMISIAQLIAYRLRTETLVQRVANTVLPTDHGTFRALAYKSSISDHDQIALVAGDLARQLAAPPLTAVEGLDQTEHMGQVSTGADTSEQPADASVAGREGLLVRVHSECLTGDVFGSRRCDCGAQLAESMRQIQASGGVLIYLRGHEGRGIGLAAKLAAYELQDAGSDTVDANLALGLPVDSRDYGVAAQILRELGVRSVRLLTNNPAKVQALETAGMPVVSREPIVIPPTEANVNYLRTKRDRLGHALPGESQPRKIAL